MGHFEFQDMTLGGMPVGESVRVTTEAGIILQSHHQVDHAHVERMAAIARTSPNHPVDISVWRGNERDRQCLWIAQIKWRD